MRYIDMGDDSVDTVILDIDMVILDIDMVILVIDMGYGIST